jgi:poly-gamma-glutamate synthesis protein (capsule biosynthesis protein)
VLDGLNDAAVRHTIKALLALMSIGWVGLWIWFKPSRTQKVLRGALSLLLGLMAVAAVAAYFEFGWVRYGRYINPYDVFHYYLGAKYAPEHRYTNFYRCVLIADAEGNHLYRKPAIRNLENHQYEAVASVLADKERIKAPFAPERWAEFCKDVRFWQGMMPPSKFEQALMDKGYNGTPVWTAVAYHLLKFFPTDAVRRIEALPLFDLSLTSLLFFGIGCTFGLRAMALALVFHGVNYMMSFVHIKGGFLRLDWFAALGLAVCALRASWFGAAGGLLAYAGATRIFPLAFGIPLLGQFMYRYAATFGEHSEDGQHTRRVLYQSALRFTAGFCVVGILALGLSFTVPEGLTLWKQFLQKIAVHNADISTTRVGFKYVFLAPFANKGQAFADHHLLYSAFVLGGILLSAWAARRVTWDEALALGFVSAYFAAAPTFYYYVMLLIPFLFCVSRMDSLWHTFGAVLLFLFTAVAYALHARYDHGFTLFWILSALLGIVSGYLCLVARWGPERRCDSSTVVLRNPRFSGMPPLPTFCPSFLRGFLLAVPIGALLAVGLLYRHVSVNRPTGIEQREEGVTLMFVGDVMFGRDVERSVLRAGGNYETLFASLASVLRSADLAFANLECPISTRGERVEKRYTFLAKPEAVKGLVSAGFDVVSVANNHTLDFGPTALADTVAMLVHNGITPLGLCDGGASQKAHIVEIHGLRMGWLAYCDPSAPYACAKKFSGFVRRPCEAVATQVASDIHALRPYVDVLLVSIHWGIEYDREPSEGQRDLGRLLIDEGADIVVGHHPHVLQEPERYGRGWILYSLGNFVFDQRSRLGVRDSRIYRVRVTRNGVEEVAYLPVEIEADTWRPKPVGEHFVILQNNN